MRSPTATSLGEGCAGLTVLLSTTGLIATMPGTPLRRDGGNTLRRVDDTFSGIEYTGQWTAGSVNITGSDQVTIHTSTQSGSTIKFSFTGTPCIPYWTLSSITSGAYAVSR